MTATLSATRSGAYNRLVEPGWIDPLDPGYSKAAGGRWNAPGAFGALYLNSTVPLARAQARYKLRGQPYDIDDLDPDEQHDLVEISVGACRALDCVSVAGLRDAGLPASYPLDAAGAEIAHAVCQPIGAAAYAQAQLQAIACRSAADPTGNDEELAVFDRDVSALISLTRRTPFAAWYFA